MCALRECVLEKLERKLGELIRTHGETAEEKKNRKDNRVEQIQRAVFFFFYSQFILLVKLAKKDTQQMKRQMTVVSSASFLWVPCSSL